MTNSQALLDETSLQAACAGRIIGRRVRVFDRISSTNDVALEWGECGEPEGCVAFAESQDAGRGQFKRTWHSASGLGMWCSVLLRPAFRPSEAACLTPFAAVAVASALRQALGLQVSLKPPNDLYLPGGKVCGLLIEARTGAQFFAVLGIGININQTRDEFPPALRGIATSLREEVGHLCDRTQIAMAVLSELDRLYAHMVDGFAEIQSLYDAWPRWEDSTFQQKKL